MQHVSEVYVRVTKHHPTLYCVMIISSGPWKYPVPPSMDGHFANYLARGGDFVFREREKPCTSMTRAKATRELNVRVRYKKLPTTFFCRDNFLPTMKISCTFFIAMMFCYCFGQGGGLERDGPCTSMSRAKPTLEWNLRVHYKKTPTTFLCRNNSLQTMKISRTHVYGWTFCNLILEGWFFLLETWQTMHINDWGERITWV